MTDFSFIPIGFSEAEPVLRRHLQALPAPVDSFFEDHVRASNQYRIEVGQEAVGWTAVHGELLITQFGLFSPYRHLGQRAFAQVRKLEQVQAAMTPTSDEFYLSHALDDFRTLEKQAYLFQHDPQAARHQSHSAQVHRQAVPKDITAIERLTGTFFDDLERRVREGQLSVACRGDDLAGFGIIEVSTLTEGVASVGMFTVAPYRHQGVGASHHRHLVDTCYACGLRPVAGCWYYNHNSKKTLERAGMVSQTRLLRVSLLAARTPRVAVRLCRKSRTSATPWRRIEERQVRAKTPETAALVVCCWLSVYSLAGGAVSTWLMTSAS